MKKLLLTLFILSFSLIYSQKGAEKISINFENITKLDVIKIIEKQTNYHFYFVHFITNMGYRLY